MQNFNITEWVDNFLDYKSNKLNWNYLEDSAKVMLSILSMELGNVAVPESLSQSFIFQVIKKRAAAVGLHCNDYFILALTTVCNNPAHAVMWVLVFRHLQDAEDVDPNNKLIYTATNFFNVTEQKVPTDEYLSRMWEAQKNRDCSFGTDNWLDAISSETAFIQATRKGIVEMRVEQ